ncbi:polyprenyl synthetase family protein [Pseudohoeflea coraliihabitans]|uniref:Polyprenyl synthetase family protein n=1 Tax=Pseudohoeflea coraliihabitans TaxID=2860393 RepID=A0ABS6WLC9_9HYPH|nr:farnesyl diphosphate synthase [Pseudohoeflea sp. DP4N28-3]MBW3096590.1 polyprenyl synthetase family protein [Pseudohoeflea sp. DP4N28-3]
MTPPATPSAFAARLAADAGSIVAFLDAELARDDGIRRHWPAPLRSAMRHGVLNGGKRLRPFLLMETARLLGGDENAALHVAAALECVHCYSLIHDDLPAMDDDALRRGQPTVHVAFDEATAILAGDALLTLAFELICRPGLALAPAAQVTLVTLLSEASGAAGMVGGQSLDLAAETGRLNETDVARMQAMKTGALLRFACEAGAVVAGAGPAERRRFVAFGERIGLAFQLADDLLDVTADSAVVGKATGKDAERRKATFVALNGIDHARRRCAELIDEAAAELAEFGASADILKEAAAFIARRDR